MSKYEHFLLNKEGLQHLLTKIKESFASKKNLKEEETRAKTAETTLEKGVEAVTTAIVEESKKNKELDSSIQDLNNVRIDKVFLDNNQIPVENRELNLYSTDIKVITSIDNKDFIGKNTQIYRAPDNTLWYWKGSYFQEVGKDVNIPIGKVNVEAVDELPFTGDMDIFYILKSTYDVYQWVGTELSTNGYRRLDRVEELNAHKEDFNNPHKVTKEQLGLSNVDNTADIDKPISIPIQTALNSKIDAVAIKDNLSTNQEGFVLSARQGVILDEKISKINTDITSLGTALLFKGVVASTEELSKNLSAKNGDCYQINSQISEDITDTSHDGEMYAWTSNGWQKVVAAAIDLSSMMATSADINDLIVNYS